MQRKPGQIDKAAIHEINAQRMQEHERRDSTMAQLIQDLERAGKGVRDSISGVVAVMIHAEEVERDKREQQIAQDADLARRLSVSVSRYQVTEDATEDAYSSSSSSSRRDPIPSVQLSPISNNNNNEFQRLEQISKKAEEEELNQLRQDALTGLKSMTADNSLSGWARWALRNGREREPFYEGLINGAETSAELKLILLAILQPDDSTTSPANDKGEGHRVKNAIAGRSGLMKRLPELFKDSPRQLAIDQLTRNFLFDEAALSNTVKMMAAVFVRILANIKRGMSVKDGVNQAFNDISILLGRVNGFGDPTMKNRF